MNDFRSPTVTNSTKGQGSLISTPFTLHSGGQIAREKSGIQSCPKDTGALKASLKLTEDKKTEVKASVKVDYDKSIKYGTFVELGARGRPANPFLRNAVDENQKQINEAIVDEIARAVGRKM